MKALNIISLLFVVVVGMNNNILSELILKFINMYYISILFGLLAIALINSFVKTRYFNSVFLSLLIVDTFVALFFPENTDYILPAKEDALIWINLIHPSLYLVYVFIKKIKNK